MDLLGFSSYPAWNAFRSDIVQTVECASPGGLAAFCRGIQSASPIDAHVTPEAWDMPGYRDPVIMAAGAFTGGASIELSADGPIKPPYSVYFQGGMTWPHAKLGILRTLQNMLDRHLIQL